VFRAINQTQSGAGLAPPLAAPPTKIVNGRAVCNVTTLLNSKFRRELSSIGWVLQVFGHDERLREAGDLFLVGGKSGQG